MLLYIACICGCKFRTTKEEAPNSEWISGLAAAAELKTLLRLEGKRLRYCPRPFCKCTKNGDLGDDNPHLHPSLNYGHLQIYFSVKTCSTPPSPGFFQAKNLSFPGKIQVQGSDPPVLDPTGLCGWQVQQVLGGYAREAFRHQHGGLATFPPVGPEDLGGWSSGFSDDHDTPWPCTNWEYPLVMSTVSYWKSPVK